MVFLAAPLINLHRRSCLCTSIPCGGRFLQAKKEENGKLPSVGNVRISQCKSAQQGETSWGLCWFCWWQCLQDPSSISKSPPTWDWILSPVQQPWPAEKCEFYHSAPLLVDMAQNTSLEKHNLNPLVSVIKALVPLKEDMPKSCNIT